ncbi:isoleucine--tRNA ligase [Xylocopilactobacillus apicola]|uniref:Isoleucine--tRNA ligase n=1 Tax=Xylocopilactobacillus apicola TaxID=2932184 RepID=A0AAU9D373_9LACO|nr:isoleucine--tRNA ligase [Xylocopilactobacillus apicola]BDR58224.1 isoleucine--tRNA ligase [Xylocopilactobacillus apicola]
MKVKDTLNLGSTNFPMRGKLPTTEPIREKQWEEDQVYEQRLVLNRQKKHFNLHDGPPYANGRIHIGHAMNKVIKDIIVRYKNMNGFYAPYVPGWDTHGLPIEQQLTKAGHDRKQMNIVDWRELARKFALEQVDIQRTDFKRLGVLGDWEHPYLTLTPEFEAQEIRVFEAMVKKGLIYRGSKPIFWSWSSESALAEAEVEYHDLESTSLYYANQVIDGKGLLDTDTYLIVWTTTPFTVTASRGITVGPDFEYSVVKPAESEKKYVIASEMLAQDAEKFGWQDYEVLKTFKGKEMERITTRHPWDNEVELLVMLGDYVTLDAGTGLVHTAPGFGEDDWLEGQKYGLPADVTVDDRGMMMANAGPDFEGVFYDKATPIVIDKLKSADLLLAVEKLTHSYPFDWRTKKPVIWRAIPQWFASVEKIRKEILEQIDHVKFSPDWGYQRLYNMIRDRGDWVISRQRAWGVPIPIFYAEDETPILDPEVIEHVAKLFEEHGSNYWFAHEAEELLPEGYTNEHSPNGKFTKENDILDVWFDSGSSWNGVLNTCDNLDYPADIYSEGSDQFRGWFNSSLITSVAMNGVPPYKEVLHQGFTLDDQGRKMSKSLGNVISPIQVADQMGVEILRLWVMSIDTGRDVKVSMELFKQVSDAYRKIRNTIRFLLSNTDDFDPKKDAVEFSDLEPIDKYMAVKWNEIVEKFLHNFDEYNFQDTFKMVMNFINVDLSAFYLDVAKDIVYITKPDDHKRRSMQTIFYRIAKELTQLLTPVLPHTAEEIWENLKEPEEYAYFTELPKVRDFGDVSALLTDWATFMKFRDVANKALEEARQSEMIGKNAEAALTVTYAPDVLKAVETLKIDVREILMVSSMTTSDGADSTVEVSPAKGEVCKRCRLTKEDVGSDAHYPDFCASCAEIVAAVYPETITEGFDA